MPRVLVEACLCNACGHVWLPKPENPDPIACAKCKSPYWDRPRVRNITKFMRSEIKPDREIDLNKPIAFKGYDSITKSTFKTSDAHFLDQVRKIAKERYNNHLTSEDISNIFAELSAEKPATKKQATAKA